MRLIQRLTQTLKSGPQHYQQYNMKRNETSALYICKHLMQRTEHRLIIVINQTVLYITLSDLPSTRNRQFCSAGFLKSLGA